MTWKWSLFEVALKGKDKPPCIFVEAMEGETPERS